MCTAKRLSMGGGSLTASATGAGLARCLVIRRRKPYGIRYAAYCRRVTDVYLKRENGRLANGAQVT